MGSSPTAARLSAALAVVMAAGLAGCGVRGALEAPPKDKAAGLESSATTADAGPDSAVKPKPHKEFPLDGLIR